MKVLFIVSWYKSHNSNSPTGIFHYEQAISLKEHCDVAIYYPFDDTLEESFLCEEENGLQVFRSKFSLHKRISSTMKILKDFKKIKAVFNPDIIHAHVSYPAGFITSIISKIFHIPYVLTEHNPVQLMNLDSKVTKIATKYAYTHSKVNFCVSTNLKEQLHNIFPKISFNVMYNGVIDPDIIGDDGIEYKKSNVINCAIIASFYNKTVKGYQYLLPAIQNLKQKGIRILLHICGSGEFFEYYNNMAKELAISDSCIFYGNCTKQKVYSITRQMDFIISASEFESAGVSAEESMLIGKPLVVTKSGGVNSLVTDKSAIIVEAKSVDDLTLGIYKMCSHFTDYDSSEIKKYAYDNFSSNIIAQRLYNTYNNILQKNT